MTSLFLQKPQKPLPGVSDPAPDGVQSVPPPQTPGDDGMMAQLTANPLFTGGIGLILLTGGAQLARKSLTAAAAHARRHMLVTLEIPSTDKSYDWFLHWMTQHHRAQSAATATAPRPPLFSAAGVLARIQPAPRQLAVETKFTQHPSGGFATDFTLLPGTGHHLINFHGTLLRVHRERDSRRIDLQRGTPWELLTITTLSSARSVFARLLAEAHSLAAQLEEGKTIIYTAWATDWKPFGKPRRKRALSSVVLAPGLKDRIVSDVRSFLRSSAWYYDRGIPYRRGYLLHGPPGSGKTSFIQALAGHLDYSICVLNLSERGLTDDRLLHLLTNLPERSIALLEDVDAAFGRRRRRHHHGEHDDDDGYRGANVTFSGLLNALDGVASSEERVVFMTTNHVLNLDEALVRPGRVDVRVEIGYAGEEVVREMWERFYGRESVQEGEGGVGVDEAEMGRRRALKAAFVNRLNELGAFEGRGWGVSTAQLQGLFVFYKGEPQRAVEEVEGLVPEEVRKVKE